MEKRYCDTCKKEINKNKISIFKETYYSIFWSGHETAEFCSKECLLKWVI